MTRVAVIGAGSWGTVLADLLAGNGADVTLWAFEPEVALGINRDHRNPLFASQASLHPAIRANTDIAAVTTGAAVICSALPSHVTRAMFERAAPCVAGDTIVVCASKGIESDSLQLMCDVAGATLPGRPFVVLSGPSFAEEVAAGQPTAIVAASNDRVVAECTQQLFSNRRFRVYTHADVVGVSIAGALKNTIAIAAGILEGLGFDNNPRAALLTRGLAEICRLGVAMGARPATFAGLAGMGDLLLTCTGALSRNRQLGIALAAGESLEEYQARHRTVVEGVNTAKAASRLAQRHGVEMPISEQVAAILFDRVSPRDSIHRLMERTLKSEDWS